MKLLYHHADWVSRRRSCLAGSCRTRRLRPTLLHVVFAVFVAYGASARGGELRGDVELVNMVARAHRANKEQIRTWRGRVLIESHETGPNPESVIYHMEGSVVFVLDRQKQAERSNWTTLKMTAIDPDTGTEIPRALPSDNLMIKDGAYYRYSYDPQLERDSEESTFRGVSIQPASARPRGGTSSSSFDPMYWFSFYGSDLGDLFDSYYKWAKEGKDLSHVAVRRDGDLVVLESRIGEILGRYTVDLRRGGNLVVYDSVTGSAKAFQFKYEYENLAGAWVPKRVTMESTVEHDEVRTHRTDKAEFIDNVVNEPIPEEEFSLVKLGIRRGDQVTDTRTITAYIVEGEEYPLSENRGSR
jgi:hypothetical protein